VQLPDNDIEPWRAYGAILVEREALCAQRPSGATLGMLLPTERASLLGLAAGPATRDDVVSTFMESVAAADDVLIASCQDETAFALLAIGGQLSPVDIRVLAVCGAVDASLELQRLVGVAHADSARRQLTVGLIERMLGPSAVDSLSADSRLTRSGFVAIDERATLADAVVLLARQVSWALRGDLSLDPGLPPDVEQIVVSPEMFAGDETVLVTGADRVRRIQAAVRATSGNAFLVGRPPSDQRGWQLLVTQAGAGALGIIIDLTTADHVASDDRTVGLNALARRWISRSDHLSWAICSAEPVALESLPDRQWIEISADEPAAAAKEWVAIFGQEPMPSRRPSAQQLQLAAKVATPGVTAGFALRRLASGSLSGMARRVTPRVEWADLVLAPSHEQRLRALVDRYRTREIVHEKWKLPSYPSPGLVALFSGPSGTGKTTAAEVIAHELAVDMFRVDLSALVSKYIGETEKNLEQIFSAAHAGDYLLLFDEADSLFGTRSKVSDSKDRYANMEVSYLLQRLETYDGFVVLTSNFQGNIDQAFLRRIHATVHFPVPDAADRRRIWTRSLAQAPTSDLDIDFIADKFDLAGGAIRNAALTSAFLAASGSGSIEMVHVLRAVSQEMQKLGRRPTPDQFGRWAAELAAD
jgi:hypothetical protein